MWLNLGKNSDFWGKSKILCAVTAKSEIHFWYIVVYITQYKYMYIDIYPLHKFVFIEMIDKLITYIDSVLVQDFVSGRACCVNQYHYESR